MSKGNTYDFSSFQANLPGDVRGASATPMPLYALFFFPASLVAVVATHRWYLPAALVRRTWTEDIGEGRLLLCCSRCCRMNPRSRRLSIQRPSQLGLSRYTVLRSGFIPSQHLQVERLMEAGCKPGTILRSYCRFSALVLQVRRAFRAKSERPS